MLRIALILFSLIFALDSAHAAKRAALVVGNGAYTQAGPLKNPANDARAVADALEKLGFHVVTGIDQTMDQMRRSLYEFAQVADGADLALF
ncbi:MAG: caspase family protein, partial [Pseudomonadota bacterium]